jgi:hypothetical protein
MPLNVLNKAYLRDMLPSNSIRWIVVGLALLVGPSSLAQADHPLTGIVTTKEGKPIAGVTVYGSMSKACCPFKREQTTTDQNGQFRIEHPGAVIHFSNEKLKPKALVIASDKAPIQVILEPSADGLIVPRCGRRDSGQKRIGWGKYGIQFNVAKHSVKILGGKPDVDYVTYLVKTKTGEEHLELWFGPYAMDELPNDDQFITSDKFAQRDVVNSDGGLLGMDSWGQEHSGKQWRQMAIVGQAGARYSNITAERASIFDAIVNSACEVPYPRQ